MQQERALPPPRPMKWGEGWGEGKWNSAIWYYTWRGLAQAGSARLRTAPVPCTARDPARMFAEGLRAGPVKKV